MNIVLVEPEIPANTGNISRTCAVTGSALHLIRPLGFSTDDRQLKRAGLDYWSLLDITYYDSLQDLWNKHPQGRFYYVETNGGAWYTDVKYGMDDFLVFGKETTGLPRDVIAAHENDVIRIPMRNDAKARSLNLSNAVAIVAFEALRQNGFPGMV
ncbi:tRNA (cytidine(34)-2'-O)-methyltransferase [Alicyclobacillus acidoterrestris]|uniref:Putative tRNA (cytidine(34)-2'-O)-methyltransferase n=1 Tax=Alicyclobacillus acidoterrestris (strain ATCC 49025 / DSM 3922 / CIP 106132 / NCIMB 13137 / GD3B) TaxID=1356854 RepID=T0CUG4_ALIAG|nr:tRNA (cytidine(34)-2'-O)-methyltransferase [Alicyclobacillus acidoterrestris]EPZ43012.1 rRNA methyltransferase [Alicyclobacillus acidoterrestris ATCC 49025]UNO49807.1 tRNA (cytidine(34)-2'-O)-methyltransferase [Alicyclobacillus acidoterrestris]